MNCCSELARWKVGRPAWPVEPRALALARRSAWRFRGNPSPITCAMRRPKRPRPLCGEKVERQPVGAREREADRRIGERQPPHRLGHGVRLGAVGAQEFQPRRRREEEVAHLDLRAGCAACRRRLALPAALHLDRPGVLVARDAATRSRAAPPRRSEASASPRKPSVAIAERSSPGSFEVQWRATASARSSRRMPPPSSATRIRLLPPPGGDDVDAAARRRRARSRRAPSRRSPAAPPPRRRRCG